MILDSSLVLVPDLHPIYLLWFQTKPEEFWFQVRVGNQQFRQFTMGFITMISFNSGLKLNPRLKPNLKPDQMNWVMVRCVRGMYKREHRVVAVVCIQFSTLESFFFIATLWRPVKLAQDRLYAWWRKESTCYIPGISQFIFSAFNPTSTFKLLSWSLFH